MSEQKRQSDNKKDMADICHAGGVNSQLGGVDPEADENLMRLSGGP